MNCEHFGNWFLLNRCNRLHISFSDSKHIERSQQRLNKIHELEQQAAYQSPTDKSDVIYRINELKGSEIQFKANLEHRKSLNEMVSAMGHLKVNDNN